MLINAKYANMEDIPGLVEKNLTANKESNFFKNILPLNKIVRYSLIQRDVNTPPDAFQELLNTVGEAYISKRNELAQQNYQTGYANLDTEKKSVIDDVAPILIKMEIPRGNSSERRQVIKGGSWKDVETYLKTSENDGDKKPTEKEWEIAAVDSGKVDRPSVHYNGQPAKENDIFELVIPETFKPDLSGEPSDVVPDDGYTNHLFYPQTLGKISKYNLTVFNRMGIMLCETKDIKRGWTGYYEGHLCDEGAYYYIIDGEFENEQSFRHSGSIRLLHQVLPAQ
jgi:hypothetical protein